MSKLSFNELTSAEAERLALLLEEAGEVQQIIGKILRHGYESTHPAGGETNRMLLERELGDLLAIVQLLVHNSDLRLQFIEEARQEKPVRMEPYLHHQNAVTR